MKKPLKPRVQGLNIQSVVIASPLQEMDTGVNSPQHFDINRFYLLDVTKSNTFIYILAAITRPIRAVDWFNGARISIKPVKVARQIGPYRALPAGPIRDKPIRKGDRSTYLTDKGKGGSYA